MIEGKRDNTGGRYFVVSVLFSIFLLLSGQRGFDSSGIEEKLESEMWVSGRGFGTGVGLPQCRTEPN